MAAQKGKDLLLKVDSDGLGTFTTVAGLRTRTLVAQVADPHGSHRRLLRCGARSSATIAGTALMPDPISTGSRCSYQ